MGARITKAKGTAAMVCHARAIPRKQDPSWRYYYNGADGEVQKHYPWLALITCSILGH